MSVEEMREAFPSERAQTIGSQKEILLAQSQIVCQYGTVVKKWIEVNFWVEVMPLVYWE